MLYEITLSFGIMPHLRIITKRTVFDFTFHRNYFPIMVYSVVLISIAVWSLKA